MNSRLKQRTSRVSSTEFAYGIGTWWGHVIQTYAAMKLAMKGSHTEQNHLVHAAFLKKGPYKTRHLWRFVPSITLSMNEHRGPTYSYHKMKDKQLVGRGKSSFVGCGMDAYLASRGINVNVGSFTHVEVSDAIDASADYWSTIGIKHAAQAIREFKRDLFDNPVYHD